MNRWHPDADIDPFDDAGGFLVGPYRGVLHTTEGDSYAGARSVYAAKRVAPHFTKQVGRLWQHIALDRAARALENLSGGVHTNLHSTIQIEIVHRAGAPWPEQLVAETRDLMIWIEGETGIKPYAPPFLAGQAYGYKGLARMAVESWVRYDGWCGHQHVPENRHWDPGPVPIDALLERGVPPMAGFPLINYPPRCVVVRPQGDGYWIVSYDGGVFSFGAAPVLGGIGGGPVERIVDADVWPDGEGLVCLGEDGGIFGLGSAQFFGRVEFPVP